MNIRKLSRGAIVALGSAALGATGLAAGARAAVVLTFGQSGVADPITGLQTGGSTTITATDAPVSVTQIDAALPLPTPLTAYLDMNLISTSSASAVSGNYQEHFSGSFSITSAAGGGGINYLSGSLIDVAFGLGTEFNLSATTPPAGNVTFTSGVIAPAAMGLDRGAGFSFADVSPALNIEDGTFGSFTGSVSGTFSAGFQPVVAPEPATLALLGAGLFGLGMLHRRRV